MPDLLDDLQDYLAVIEEILRAKPAAEWIKGLASIPYLVSPLAARDPGVPC